MVQLGYGGSARTAVYDRNGSGQGSSYNGTGVAPHALTQRWQRTVPAGQTAVVQTVYCAATRRTAAAPVGLVEVVVTAALAGATPRIASMQLGGNAVGDTQQQGFSLALPVPAGGTITGFTADVGTGGTVDYALSFSSVEFAQ